MRARPRRIAKSISRLVTARRFDILLIKQQIIINCINIAINKNVKMIKWVGWVDADVI